MLGAKSNWGCEMREYARISPKFWVGETGKQIRSLGAESQLLAMYLMTSPHSNMLGLYWCPINYIAHETGLTLQGASKALQRLIDCGFCDYDSDSEFVWVVEMAKYQIGDALKPTDKQSKGVQNTYDDLPRNPYLCGFYEKYSVSFCMTNKRDSESKSTGIRRGIEGASMGLASKEKEKEKETDKETIDRFQIFKDSYPNKKAMKDAQKAFEKLNPTEELFQTMIGELDKQKQNDQWLKEDGRFVPLPATWIRGERWNDTAEQTSSYNFKWD